MKFVRCCYSYSYFFFLQSSSSSSGAPEKRRLSGRFSFGRAIKPKAGSGVSSCVVPVELHAEPRSQGKTRRTLSPEFLRKRRPHPSGVKRSLSASPKAVHHPTTSDMVERLNWASTTSSPSIRIRNESTGMHYVGVTLSEKFVTSPLN